MKKLIVVIVLLLLGVDVYGQSLNYFLKGGISISNTTFTVIERGVESGRERDNRYSFYFGGGIERSIGANSDKLHVQIELIYSEQGWVYHYTDPGDYLTHEINQINLPITLKKEYFKNLHIVFGGYIGQVIHSKEKSSDSNNRFEVEKYKNLDAGLLAGIEYNFNIGIIFEARYMHGLMDISKVSYPLSFIEHEYKNRVIHIGIGYRF